MLISGPHSHVFVAFGLAAFLHLLLWRVRVPISWVHGESTESTSNEIVLEPWTDPRQIVETSRGVEQEQRDKTAARFGAEFRNRVAEEMQSPLHGKFREGGRGEPRDPEGALPPSLSDLTPFGRNPHVLPKDIPLGPRTLLNTDPVLYASFINRIGEEIYDPWNRYVRGVLDWLGYRGRKIESDVYITKLMVVIDREGSVTAIQTLESCGISELDETPKKAFWDMEPFPNPPEQMFKEENTAKFIYEFHIDLKRSFFNIRPWST